jgi:hypothetical protein
LSDQAAKNREVKCVRCGGLEMVEIAGLTIGYLRPEPNHKDGTWACCVSGFTVGRFRGLLARERAIERLLDYERANAFLMGCQISPEKERAL